MHTIIHISQKPTFDLEKVQIIHYDSENALCYFKSLEVFKFDGVFGNLENRSRILRLEKEESSLVEQVVSASIDAGFCGHLVWKIILTKKGQELLQKCEKLSQCAHHFSGCQQIHLFPSPAGNYYNGSNQTNDVPDIVFSI